MEKILVKSAAVLVLVLGSARADAGYLYLEWMDCNTQIDASVLYPSGNFGLAIRYQFWFCAGK